MSAPRRAVHTVFPVELDHIREVAARFNARLSESDVLLNVAAILAEEFNASRAAIVIAVAGQHSPRSQPDSSWTRNSASGGRISRLAFLWRECPFCGIECV